MEEISWVKDFYALVKSGKHPVVMFTKESVEYIEDSFDPQMIGKIIGTSQDEYGYMFRVDMKEFEEHNRSVPTNDWFDKDGNATLTWFETNFYPIDGIVKFYLPPDIEVPLEITEENSLVSEYLSSKTDKSYVTWLEEQLLLARDSCKAKVQNIFFTD